MIAKTTLLFSVLMALVFFGCGDSPPEPGQSSSPDQTETIAGHHHDVAGETCFICDEGKRDRGRLWCTEHDRYEDRCWMCQPQLEEEGRLWCIEHSLYEDECFLCHPELNDNSGQDEESTSHADHGLFCNEHQVPEAECGICQPQLTASLNSGDQLKIRFESKQSASKAGIQILPALSSKAQASISAFCEVAYNGNALARITPFAAGIVGKVFVDVGQEVEAGDVLIELHSAEVANAKSAYVSAIVDYGLKKQTFEREQGLAGKRISSEREVQEAEAALLTAELKLRTSRQVLLNYGITENEVDAIRDNRDTSAVLYLRAPFRGTLVDRDTVVGEAVEPGHRLFSLANLETMWLSLSVPADQADLLREGLPVEARFAGNTVRGEVEWVTISIDKKSRMLQARAVVSNADRKLSVGTFGDALVFVGDPQSSVEVPRAAVQKFEGQPYVFIKLEDDLYSLRRVTAVDSPSKDMVAITSGLWPGESVVSTGAFTVMSEFLKSRLGAGCVDD